ncbi:MAG TPA: helix-turn-helix domain-containing protein [Solirubrobacteraceae bacterium]|nr:helix-turn-helix domain-containing protein [Solirubrobacteraceae bacterium]
MIDDKETYLTPEEVCERLNVSDRWLRRANEKGILPRVKMGLLNRYPESGIEAYIEANRVPARQS